MSIVLNKIKSLVKSRKLNMFLLFFVLAFFILILARLSASYTNTINFNVDLKDIPDKMIVVNDSSHTLNITMTTYGFQWLKYYLRKPSVFINFKDDIKKKDSTYVWSLSRGFPGINSQFGKDINVKSINPDTLSFNVDINAVKTVTVKPNLKLEFSPGYNVLKMIKTQPDSVKIIGPESLLSSINSLETEVLELTNLNKPFNSKLALKLDSINPQIRVKTKNVTVTVNAEKFTEGTVNVPIKILNLPKKIEINYFPKSVTLSYYTSLEKYNTINANDFEVVCDFKEHDKNATFLTPKLDKAPEDIKSARVHEQRIEYIISE